MSRLFTGDAECLIFNCKQGIFCPLAIMMRNPQYWCLAFRVYPRIHLLPRVSKRTMVSLCLPQGFFQDFVFRQLFCLKRWKLTSLTEVRFVRARLWLKFWLFTRYCCSFKLTVFEPDAVFDVLGPVPVLDDALPYWKYNYHHPDVVTFHFSTGRLSTL